MHFKHIYYNLLKTECQHYAGQASQKTFLLYNKGLDSGLAKWYIIFIPKRKDDIIEKESLVRRYLPLCVRGFSTYCIPIYRSKPSNDDRPFGKAFAFGDHLSLYIPCRPASVKKQPISTKGYSNEDHIRRFLWLISYFAHFSRFI